MKKPMEKELSNSRLNFASKMDSVSQLIEQDKDKKNVLDICFGEEAQYFENNNHYNKTTNFVQPSNIWVGPKDIVNEPTLYQTLKVNKKS